MMKKLQKSYIKPFKIEYFFWGHAARIYKKERPDGYGFCDDLAEAYGNASRHLGRGSVYFRAIIIDREQEKPLAILTRYMGEIKIKEF